MNAIVLVDAHWGIGKDGEQRSEEHTSELQSRDSIPNAVFCLKKKKTYPLKLLYNF